MLFRRSPPQSPLPEDDRLWIERRLTWLCGEFGRDRLQFGTFVLPTVEFFPEAYEPTEAAVHALLGRVCDYMGVEPRRVSLRFFSLRRPIYLDAELMDARGSAFAERAKRITIWLDTTLLENAYAVVARLAHELALVHLFADGRMAFGGGDYEPLSDLLTVFLGLGIFTANADLRDGSWTSGPWTSSRVGRSSKLTAALYGYALALCARCRGDEPCPWRKLLRPDVRSVFDKGLRFLDRSGAPRFPQQVAGPLMPRGAIIPPLPALGSEGKPAWRGASAAAAEDVAANDEDAEGQDADQSAQDTLDENAVAVDACYERGLIHYRAGAFQEAISEASEAIARLPDDPELYTLRARAHLGLEQYRQALEDAERAVALDAGDADARRARGIALANTGEPRRAIEDFDFLLGENRQNADAYYHRGLAYAALGQHRRALADYGKAIVKAPNMVETYFARHQAYKELGEHDKAAADLQEGLWRRARLTRESL